MSRNASARSERSATRATFLGRFQPYHEGHHRVVEWAREEYDVVLALGSPQQDRTAENPLTATERETLISACQPDVELVRVPDENRGEEGYPVWAERLVQRTDADVVCSRNELVQRLVRERTTARIEEQPEFDPERFSGRRSAVVSGQANHGASSFPTAVRPNSPS